MPSPTARTGPFGRTAAAAVFGCIGIAVVIAGTFLPWVDSGLVSRNLYRVAGVAQRIGVFGPQSSVATWLSLIGPLCVLPLLLGVLRLRRTAAWAGIVIAALVGGAAAAALVITGGRSVAGISLDVVGPGTVLAGAVLMLVAGLIVLLPIRRTGRAMSAGSTERAGIPPTAAIHPGEPLPTATTGLHQNGSGTLADPSH